MSSPFNCQARVNGKPASVLVNSFFSAHVMRSYAVRVFNRRNRTSG